MGCNQERIILYPTSFKAKELVGLFAYSTTPLAGVTGIVVTDTLNAEGYDFVQCADIVTIDFPNLSEINNYGYIEINNCVLLTRASFPQLSNFGNGGIVIRDNTVLADLSFPSLVSYLSTDCVITGCALTVESVNSILATFARMLTFGAGQTLSLDGGTSATPAGQGIVDKATIVARGATVNTN